MKSKSDINVGYNLECYNILLLFTQNELIHCCNQSERYKVSCVLSFFMIAYIFKDKVKVAGDINSLNLLIHLKIVEKFYATSSVPFQNKRSTG